MGSGSAAGKRLLALAVLVALVSTMTVTAAGAAIDAGTGQVEVIDPPASVVTGALESDTAMFAFDERQRVVLDEPIPIDITDPGTYDTFDDLVPFGDATIPAGTIVDSHFVHADPPGTETVQTVATLTFPDEILGILVRDRSLNETDAVLGAPETLYPTGQAARGLELIATDVVVLPDLHTIQLTLKQNIGIDQLRVVTLHQDEPLVAGLELGASPVEVPAGVGSVPLANIPPGALGTVGGDSTTGSTALARIALARIALARIDVEGTALARIALARIAVEDLALARIDLADSALARILMSEVSVEGGLEALLVGTVFEGLPPQTFTLADVLADPVAGPRLEALTLESLDVSATSLGEVPLIIFAFGGQPLADIALSDSGDPLGDWCSLLELTDCSTLVDQTPVSAALARIALARIDVMASALARIALARIDVETAALARIALARIDVSNTALARIALARIDIEGTALARIALARIALARIGDVVDCNLVDCVNGTLGDAAAAGALLGDIGALIEGLQATGEGVVELEGLTIGDLLLALAGLPELDVLTLAELFPTLFSDADLPWERIDLEAYPLQNVASPLVPPVTYTATFTVGGGFGDVDAELDLDLPDGFVLVPGTATLDDAAIPDPGPADPGAGELLTFDLGVVDRGMHTLTVDARAGLQLGPALATSDLRISTALDADDAHDEVAVLVVEEFEPTEPGDAFKVLDPLALYVAHVGSATDRDLYQFVVTADDVEQGAAASINMSNLVVDYDLVLYGPERDPLRGDPLESFVPVEDVPLGIDPAAAVLPPDVLDDIPIDASLGSVIGVSANRSTGDERIDTGPLPAGTYWVQVSAYNGGFDDHPYTLRLRSTTTQLGECLPRPLTHAPVLGAPVDPSSLPSDLDTLFVVPVARLYETYGAARADAVIDALDDFVAAQAGGVVSAVVPVDWHADVRDAYATWDADRCSPELANDVVREIGVVLDDARAARPGVRHVVLVGDDALTPMARVPDATVVANERTYAGGFADNNELVGSLGLGYLLSDDAYGASRGIALNGRELFVPELGLGRLVESPEDVVDALERFIAFDGTLDPSTATSPLPSLSALVTGYDFLTDGGEAVRDALVASGFDPVDDSLISDTWTADDLAAALVGAAPPNVAAVNGHFDHNRALPADQNAAGTEDDLFTVNDVAGTGALLRSLVFSMGCHAGLSVSDVAVGGPATDLADWAQTFAQEGALFVGNTGYGYGDTEIVALSERLMALFAQGLDGSLTTGQALMLAKQAYAQSAVVFSPYDEKILQEAIHYGLPMYRVDGTEAGVATLASSAVSLSAVDGTDPITGVPTASLQVDLPIAASSGPGQLHRVDTPDGSYFEVDGQVIAVQHRPVQPRYETDVTDPDLVAHGFLVTGLTSTDLTGFTPLFFQPIVDDAGNEDLGEPIGDAIFPATLGRVARSVDVDGVEHASLQLAAGQFRPTGTGVGTQRLFTEASVRVQYADPSVTDFDPPTILQSRGALVPVLGTGDAVITQTAGFAVDTDPSAQRVYVLFKAATGSGVWDGVDLVRTPGTDHWTGGAVVPNDVEQLEFLVQACDANGNCSMSDNKASGFVAEQDPVTGDLGIAVSGASQSAGWWLGAVQAAITAAPGAAIEYSLDGGEFTDYSGPVPIGGEGVHFLSARDDQGNSGSLVVPIDTLGPVVSATVTPAPDVSGWHTAPATVDLGAIDPGGSGVASIAWSATGGNPIAPTSAPGDTASVVIGAEGTTTVTVSATDAAGNVGLSIDVAVRVDLNGPVVSCGSGDGQWHATNVSIACTASDAGAGLASASDASFSLSTSVADGVETSNASTGARDVCDVFGRCTIAGPISGNKVDRKAPTITIGAPVSGALFAVGQSVTPSFSCNDGGSGVASCTSNGVVTSTIGTRTFTVTAVDAVGNVSTLSRSYTVGYRICLLYNPNKPSPKNSATPIKLRLCDASGANHSTASIELAAVTVDGVHTPPPFPGSSNTDFLFRFDTSSQSYIYNLDSSQLPIGKGSHTLEFSVDGEQLAPYVAPFALK